MRIFLYVLQVKRYLYYCCFFYYNFNALILFYSYLGVQTSQTVDKVCDDVPPELGAHNSLGNSIQTTRNKHPAAIHNVSLPIIKSRSSSLRGNCGIPPKKGRIAPLLALSFTPPHLQVPPKSRNADTQNTHSTHVNAPTMTFKEASPESFPAESSPRLHLLRNSPCQEFPIRESSASKRESLRASTSRNIADVHNSKTNKKVSNAYVTTRNMLNHIIF